MGVLEYGKDVHGIGDEHGMRKSKGKKHYSVTQHIEDHLGC